MKQQRKELTEIQHNGKEEDIKSKADPYPSFVRTMKIVTW